MKKIFALILALVMVASLAACTGNNEPAGTTTAATTEGTTAATTEATTAATTEGTAVMTYAEFVAAELDAPVVVESYIQATQGWWDNAIVAYTQNEEGAYFVYKFACSEDEAAKLVPGTKVRITGYKAEYKGEIEITDASFEILEGNWTATALDVTDLLGTDDLITHQNKLVAFKGMTVETITDKDGNEKAFLYNWDGSGESGSDLYFNVSINGATYNFCVESYLTGADTDVYKAVEALKVGDVIDMEGFLYWYDGVNPHITSVTPVK